MYAHLRIARPTNDLGALATFYRDLIGFEVIASFRNHDGFDGVMLGHVGLGHHLEFTLAHGHEACRAPSPEHLLVFYVPDATEYEVLLGRFSAAGLAPVPSFNPYWDRCGVTFEDPDGYRIVLVEGGWK